MLDAYKEPVKSSDQQPKLDLTLATIKDYLLSKGGKVKYADLFDKFRDQIVDSTTETKFQDFVSNLAIRKFENDSYDEWIILKKVFYKDKEQTLNSSSTPASPNTGFFASKLQKTKQSLTKFSKTLNQQNGKEKCNDLANKSLNSSTNSLNSNCSSSNFHGSNSTSSYSSSNLTDINDFHAPNQVVSTTTKRKPKFTTVQSNSNFYLNNNAPYPLSAASRTQSSFEIFETDSLINDISLSKTSTLKKDRSDANKSEEKNNQDDTIVAVKSVKEHAKKLNRLNTQMELSLNSTPQKNRKYSLTKEQNVPLKQIELESFDLTNPDPIEKEWIITCSRCEYMDINKSLSKYPYLAQKKDPFTGYTCAHWACKYGHVEVLKLIASTLENDQKTNTKSIRINHLINSRTRAGYTCLHIAYIFKHGDLAPILKTYGAEGLIDYSGKQAIEYSGKQNDFENYSLSRPQSFLFERASPHSELYSDTSRKSSMSDNTSNNSLDISSIVKRTSSILMKDKEKDSKILKSKLTSLQYESKTKPPSPLATIEPCQNATNSTPGFLHPSVLFRNKQSKLQNDDTFQNPEPRDAESKENIFI